MGSAWFRGRRRSFGTQTTQTRLGQIIEEVPVKGITTGRFWLTGLFLFVPIACSNDDDEMSESGGNDTPEVLVCSSDNPTGTCDGAQTCIDGNCVTNDALCSVTHPYGQCAAAKVCFSGQCVACDDGVYTKQPAIGVDSKEKLTVDDLEFKDSSGDGELDPYEDWRLPEICRAKDLASKMSVPEKVGLMSETTSIGSGSADGTVADTAVTAIQENHVRQALIRLGERTGQELAVYLNGIQKLSEAEPWGIPFVVTTDPSHGFGLATDGTTGTQSYATLTTVLSPWPYPLGIGAINDIDVTRQFGDTVRKEFMAMGFRWELGPMADLATEPRWARVQNTFGENAYHVANHAKACIEGFQAADDGGLKNGIAATMKHFPGAGPNESGKDSHSRSGKYNVYPGGNFEYHQIPFRAAIEAEPAAVMPCYSIFKGQLEYAPEQTGAAFSRSLITDYMKHELGFTGMVTSDWGTMSTTAWGVEALSQPQRAAMFIKAGSHQLGNDSYTIVQAAFDQGLLTEEELNGVAEKILEMSFKLGIFENPYVDATKASTLIRSEENLTNGFVAQKKAVVLLKNRAHEVPLPVLFFLPDTATKYLPITGAKSASGAYACDTDADEKVEVYYDGVSDGLTGEDIYSRIVGDYDYTSSGSGSALPIVAVSSAAQADMGVLRITARKGSYFGLDDGVPLSFDAPFPGALADPGLAAAIKDRNKVIDLLRIRDGYTDSTGTTVAATNPNLKIVLVMHMDRPGIVKPFVNGLKTLDETLGVPGSYPSISDAANQSTTGLNGVDGFLVEFGAFDRAVLDVLFNKNVPTTPTGYVYGGRLPMEIPSSDRDVEEQYEDMPADTWSPTYALGAGLAY